MAFNFNWSPLIADTSRAREMLTTALNKSPKPPIIVDDIIVNELNLGSTPPELEILEIGDLAEDRFRGIFKMTYAGDAFLTLKTKVQANPLNTYLSGRPSFVSPEPLAAASGLTIPLQITLSEIRLSGFVILVFSRQKGLTLVFRNDPLESLKVSSTFDSIPFVRDYLQKEIEAQLRILFMDDLPAIIHRLSLRLWSPEYQELETEERLAASLSSNDAVKPIDPLATPAPDAVDEFGHPLDETQISDLSLDTTEVHATFSQKNVLRLAALTSSNRTLSLFTPSLRDTVFRALANNAERLDSGANTPGLTVSSLARIQSAFNGGKSHSSSVASGSTGNDTQGTRPSLASYPSGSGGLSLGANRSRLHPTRKRKHRVVNLRQEKEGAESSDVSPDVSTAPPSTGASEIASVILEEPDRGDVTTPPMSPDGLGFGNRHAESEPPRLSTDVNTSTETLTPSAPAELATSTTTTTTEKAKPAFPSTPLHRPRLSHSARLHTSPLLLRSLSFDKVSSMSAATSNPLSPSYIEASSSGGILEQAWMLKMAQEIARKVEKEKSGRGEMWDDADAEAMDAPPAYEA
jgi:distribution and morphology protein 34